MNFWDFVQYGTIQKVVGLMYRKKVNVCHSMHKVCFECSLIVEKRYSGTTSGLRVLPTTLSPSGHARNKANMEVQFL